MSSTSSANPRSNPELRSLYEVSLLPQPDRLQDYFLGVLAVLSDYFPIRYGALVLRDFRDDSLNVEAIYGTEKEIHPIGCTGRKGTISRVLECRQPMAIHDLDQEPLYAETGGKRIEKIRSPLLCVPLITENEAFGVINIDPLYGSRTEFAEDFQFLSILSAILSPVIKSYQMRKEEPLPRTGKPKPRSPLLDEILEERLAEALNKIDPYVEAKAKLRLLDDIVTLVEKILIKSALKRVDYVQIAAARLLGINRNTLRKKMKELKIKVRSD
ncbi:MAG: GAF domain-containing protein [Syntrophaceae bacterium]|nr:GAF domain-containing protein [Syntrophaceae bacterium]